MTHKKNFYRIFIFGLLLLVAIVIAVLCPQKKKVAVSVVMPVYNTENYLDTAILSILNQSFKNLELIIVDDASTDSSPEIIKKYAKRDRRIKTFTMPKNSGAGAARNEGIKHIEGEYVLFVDSDDWLTNTTLERSYNYAVNLKLDMVWYYATIYDESVNKYYQDEKVYKKIAFLGRYLDDKQLQVFSYKNFPLDFFQVTKKYPWNKLIKTSLIKEHHLQFDNVRHHNDSFFITMAMVFSKRIGYLKEPLYYYRVNRLDSISASADWDAASIYETFEKIKNELIINGFYPELQMSLNKWMRGWLWYVRRAGKYDESQAGYEEKLKNLIQ